MQVRVRGAATLTALSLLTVGAAFAPEGAGASAAHGAGALAAYAGKTPLAKIAPGTVLSSQTVSYHLVGIPTPIQVIQLQYRSTNERGQASTNVTSILEPPTRVGSTAVSYQSFYDSLNPADEPSVQFAGDVTSGGSIADAESGFIVPELLQGIPVIVPDTEGQQADFAAGPEYGKNTLDSIRAAINEPGTGIDSTTQIGLIGYSGGAIATGWASQLAPQYAPDVNGQLVGAAEGGVFVDPAHNLTYVSGSEVWAGVMVMAIIGISRSEHIDLTPYLSDYGLSLYTSLQSASIGTVLGEYPGLTFAQLVKPQYANPNSIPLLVKFENKLNMGSAASPTIPLFIGQGADGVLEGTPVGPTGVGPGDGVMVTGDVRSLARQFCTAGTTVDYTEYDQLSHFTTVGAWAPAAEAWLTTRFAGQAAPNNCADIAPGNSLARQHVTR